MERDKFTFFRSYWEALKELDDNMRLQLYEAICAYALTGTKPELEGIAKAMWALMEPTLSKGISLSERGKQGGENHKPSESQKQANENRLTTKKQANENRLTTKKQANENRLTFKKEHEKEKEKEKEKEEEVGSMKEEAKGAKAPTPLADKIPPTKDMVKDYILAQGYEVDADRFMDYYASQGWLLANGRKMKDWRAAVRLWESRDRPKDGSSADLDAEFDQYWKAVSGNIKYKNLSERNKKYAGSQQALDDLGGSGATNYERVRRDYMIAMKGGRK